MASKLDALKREARRVAKWRGHTMRRFTLTGPGCAYSYCTDCGASVQVDIHPMPNGIDIGGNAVAIGCNDPRGL